MKLSLLALTSLALGCATILPQNRAAESCERPWKVCLEGRSCYYCQEATIGGAANCIRTITSVVENNNKIDLLILGNTVVEMSWLEKCSAPYHRDQYN